ncbi:MAG: RsmE family RNA methyltransferase [Candidatus Eiseniibacteriota bacterium]
MSHARGPRRPDTVFWVEPASVRSDHLTLDDEESHHLLRVHRAVAGASFAAIDGAGTAYECVLESAERGIAVGRIERRIPDFGEPAAAIRLLVGLPDMGPAEAVVEHAVPLGATAIDFFVAARSGRPALTAPRIDRLNRIARSALKQSLRCRLPDIRSSGSLREAVDRSGEGRRYVADPRGSRLRHDESGASQGPIIIAIGPPGGLDEREGLALADAEFIPISLVSNRLTTETATVALLAMARNALF